MNFQFSHPWWLLALPLSWAWVLWLGWRSDVQLSRWRRWLAVAIRLLVVLAVVLAVAGLQWKRPLEGMNVFFLLDRSDSIPAPQEEAARQYVNEAAAEKKKTDRAGVLVFGSDASLESDANVLVQLDKINAVVPTEGTDLGAAIRLGTAAFPETGQKRLVLLSDGNENMGDAMNAILAARPLGVTLDVLPLGIERHNDVSVQKLVLPERLKKGQTFDVKIFLQSDRAEEGTVRLYRNEQFLGEQKVPLAAGKNLFTFPQTLNQPGFYSYHVEVEAGGDSLPQNNRATSFTNVRGDPRVLVVSAAPDEDQPLAEVLQAAKMDVTLVGATSFPGSLAELQSYDSIFLSNVAAGDLGMQSMKLLESAVQDFGVGLVCIGGDQAFAAGAYRGTPLEEVLPVSMDLNSKKVLPNGAVVLVMHGMEFMNGNQVARECALGVLDALGPQDEMGVVLWDGSEHWLFDLSKVGDKREKGRLIAGMNQGDLPSFQNVMSMGYDALKKSTANLKHMIVFSDGDPGAPSPELMQSMVADKITVSTVWIAGHMGPERMQWIADQGKGRFYNIQDPNQLPQIFIKEAAVILKSAIFEEPFIPQLVASSELVRGIAQAEYPPLLGYVCTTAKPRAETPLVSDKGDPILAHWQYGLGRAVAFTSDAKAKWARQWMAWSKYRQFWTQTAQWSLRRLENSDFNSNITIEKGQGHLVVEALDEHGSYRNYLNLESIVVSPKGDKQTVRLEQTGPGRYEAQFPARDVGSYVLNLMQLQNGQVQGSQVVGASVNYSPEFNATEPNFPLLRRLVEAGGGEILSFNSGDNPFLHDRKKTFQPVDLWEWLLKFAVILFPFDVAVRRIQIDREEWRKATAGLRRLMVFWKKPRRPAESDESLAALLARRDAVRTRQTRPPVEPRPELFQPEQAAPAPAPKIPSPSSAPSKEPTAEQPAAPSKEPESVTSRLLEAKRRAQKKKRK